MSLSNFRLRNIYNGCRRCWQRARRRQRCEFLELYFNLVLWYAFISQLCKHLLLLGDQIFYPNSNSDVTCASTFKKCNLLLKDFKEIKKVIKFCVWHLLYKIPRRK